MNLSAFDAGNCEGPSPALPEEAMEERVEAALWANVLMNHPNPMLRDLSDFLSEGYSLGLKESGCSPGGECILTAAQVQEASRWYEYFQVHSHPGLRDATEWFEEWHPEAFTQAS